jgi:uncharacterized protein (TIGR03083 family)
MTTTDDQEAAYAATRNRIDAITRSLDASALGTTVPCCPLWSVKDLVGHLAGLLKDRADANLPTSGFDAWTMAQVQRHRGEPITTVLDTWNAMPIESELQVPSMAALSFDVVTHEHDLCHAVGVAGDRSSDAVRLGSDRAAERMASVLDAAGAPGVRVTTEDGEQLLGDGAAPIPLATTRYGLLRLVTGRVSRAQADAMAWDGDAAPVLDALFADGFFVLQPVDVIEATAS